MKLSAISIKRLPPGLHGDGQNLYLQVSKTFTRSWIFRYRLHGKSHSIGLGATHTVSLAEARAAALECRKLVRAGVDPIDAKKAKKLEAAVAGAKTMTFAEAAERYIEANRPGWRNALHAKQWSTTLADYVYPAFGHLPVAAIDTALVLKALEPIWQTKAVTAGRVRGRIESVLDYAAAIGRRSGDNPARWRGHLANIFPHTRRVNRIEHHAAMPYAEMPGFMVELRAREGLEARALEWTILTATRAGEVLKATWSEISPDSTLWTIPADHTKTHNEHRVPLSETAQAILATLERKGPAAKLFPIARTAMIRCLRRLRGELTVHGFRSSFADWAAEQTTFPSEVRELALGHSVGDRVEQAYRRTDMFEKRRALAEAWSRFCAEAPTANVIPIRVPR